MRKYSFIKYISLFLILISENVLATDPILCPPDFQGTSGSARKNYLVLGDIGTVSYQHRTNGNGETEIVMDWSSFVKLNNSLKDETVKDILQEQAVLDMVTGFPGPYTIYAVYQTECKANLKCKLELSYDLALACCTDESKYAEVTGIYTEGIHKYYNYYYTVTCGYKCCRKVYIVERWLDSLHGYVLRNKVNSVTVQTYPGSTCTGTSSFYDCLYPLVPVPCIGNCD